ncbi:hypothetical protein AGMMS50239_09420 [Bacteroidia bacterium]|nr:hypothetical protein AGMMS50239_09420 [Bacteroidia bacterium]
MHEYGHYLVSGSVSSGSYALGSVGSAWNILTGGSGHSEMFFEQAATNLGWIYYGSYYNH